MSEQKCETCGYLASQDELEEQGEGLCPACGNPIQPKPAEVMPLEETVENTLTEIMSWDWVADPDQCMRDAKSEILAVLEAEKRKWAKQEADWLTNEIIPVTKVFGLEATANKVQNHLADLRKQAEGR